MRLEEFEIARLFYRLQNSEELMTIVNRISPKLMRYNLCTIAQEMGKATKRLLKEELHADVSRALSLEIVTKYINSK